MPAGSRPRRVAVTGATGLLGAKVARRRAERGERQVLLARDPSRALTGVDTLLMVSASETPDRVERHLAFIDAASVAGVGHVVYTSFQGAAPAATFTLARDHWATEEHLLASRLAHHPARQPVCRLPAPDGG